MALVLAIACTTVTISERPVTLLPLGVDRADARAAIVFELAQQALPARLAPGAHISEETLVPLLGERLPADSQKPLGWYPESLGPDAIDAGYHYGRNHYLRAAIRIEERGVRASIVQSQGMNQDGQRIHRAALAWMGDLEERIRTGLARMAALRRASDSAAR